MMTTQKQVRAAFWQEHEGKPGINRKRIVQMGDHKCHNTDTRCAFVDFVDHLQRSGEISEQLADRVRLD